MVEIKFHIQWCAWTLHYWTRIFVELAGNHGNGFELEIIIFRAKLKIRFEAKQKKNKKKIFHFQKSLGLAHSDCVCSRIVITFNDVRVVRDVLCPSHINVLRLQLPWVRDFHGSRKFIEFWRAISMKFFFRQRDIVAVQTVCKTTITIKHLLIILSSLQNTQQYLFSLVISLTQIIETTTHLWRCAYNVYSEINISKMFSVWKNFW